MSWYSPQPRQAPKRLPRRHPPKTIPSGIGDEGIVGNWLMYYLKGGDHLHDFSPENNHGTISGGVWKDGRYGWALKFNASEKDYVKVPDDPSLDFGTGEDFTVSCWFKLPSSSDWGGINKWVSGGGGYFLEWSDGVAIRAQINDGTDQVTVDGLDPTVGTWYYVVAVYDRDGNMELFVNGDLQGTADITAVDDVSNALDLHFGHDQNIDTYTNSIIPIFRMYSVTKSASWVERRFERTKGIFGL